MPFAMNRSGRVSPLRPNDSVRIETAQGDLGIERVTLGLAVRDHETHCLVALPAIPPIRAAAAATTMWLRMRATYVGEQPGSLTPFYVFIVGYAQGVQVTEDRLRFFAGEDAALIVLPLPMPTDADADHVQLMLYADRRLDGTLSLESIRIINGPVECGIGQEDAESRPINLARSWRQDGSRVVCTSYFGEHWAQMPPGWRIDDVHPAALAAADWLLYGKVDTLAFGVVTAAPDPDDDERRHIGSNVLLSFSLGTESTAALSLLPDGVQGYYCMRPYRSYTTPAGSRIELPDQTLWADRLATLDRVIVVPNTFESLQLAAGGRHGFAHNFGYAAIGLLLADHLDAGALAFGSVMEQVYLRSGNLYTDVVALQRSSFNSLRRLVESAGVFFALPTAGCSEVLTTRISDEGRFSGLAISCPRPLPDGSPCRTCFKCFRKLRLEGAPDLPEPDPSVLQVLAKHPLKSATSVVYAAQRSGYRHPMLDRYMDTDLGFLERYYPYAVDHMLPEPLRNHVRDKLAGLGIAPMTDEDEFRLRTVGRTFWPEQFTWAKAGVPDPATASRR